jgi:septal ring factor EnvC (AmiA/AmiB activator)
MRAGALVLCAALLLGAGGDDAVRDELERIQIELMHADEQLRGASARVRELEAELAVREAELQELEATLAERQVRMGRRVRAMYRMRHRGFLPLLFSARSAHELLRNARSLWWIVRADRDALDAFGRDQAAAAALRSQLAQDRSRLLQQAGEVYTRREEDRGRLAGLQGQLGTSSGRGDAGATPTRRSRVLVEAPAERVDVRLDGTATEEPPTLAVEELTPASTFPRGKGLLPLPATGSIERSGRGIDLLAPRGAPIHAVADGVVSKVLTVRGFGLVAIVDHGDGWHTVYGHGEAFTVAAGERVRTGDVLGTVGETGSMHGPRLHFEVRNAREAEDPLLWLKVPPGLQIR